MNVACSFKPTAARHLGMDHLISQYRRLGSESFGSDFPRRLEEAALQLEQDTRWDAHLTDLLAVALTEAAEEFAQDGSAERALARLYFLYTHGKAAQDLEENWRSRMESLPLEALESPLTRDLAKALKAAARGKTALVVGWLEQTETRILTIAERYETLPITTEEVTTESVLGHRLLQEGIEGWLEALAAFRDGIDSELDETKVREMAWQAQKRLKFVESLKHRHEGAHRKYFVSYN